MYLAVVLDLFSRRVVGWARAKRMETDSLTPPALHMALFDRGDRHIEPERQLSKLADAARSARSSIQTAEVLPRRAPSHTLCAHIVPRSSNSK